MSDNNDLGAFLAGFVIGGLVGAATALILAPRSGEEMRTQIAGRSRELRTTGGERVAQYRERAGQSFADAGGRMQEQARIVLDTGKERAAQMREQVVSHAQKDGEGDAGDEPTAE
ncbi:MAG: YtxH domain-containing protein [Anaerolineae bacterium]